MIKFTAPPFDPGKHQLPATYFWWSWSPKSNHWMKSCWGGETPAEAWEVLSHAAACGMASYHNKLIREHNGKFTEHHDLPLMFDAPLQTAQQWTDAVLAAKESGR